ncbi:hypothetical protein NUU61_005365 [Penicillium alfredii]|uniref:WD repeat protein n=1 Tax=Penicillium alfredii TaxID=1506179 RepID=A0A9W9F9F6_9EURO|nr:uncharacterized protein NUU61_005365 [Penicillium alfredii]KAJ5096009.1 hypothetical protein NUU61_005365 [Penicillium alfredii]
MSNPASFDSNRRSAVFGRQPEELHIPSTGLNNPNLSRQPSSHDYPTTPDAGATQLPSINVHTSSQQLQYGSSGASGNNGGALPGALTPGNHNRPPAVSVNTAPSVIPTLPQSSQHTSQRSSMVNLHGHSRSSPAGFDQSIYKQHGGSDGSRYPSSPGGGYPPQTPQGSKYSPLGLADIRPPGDHLLGDTLMSPGSLPYNGDTQVPTNSNYLAPWPIYAVDWCKWPIAGNSSSFGGKLALGSYLEDNHNYIQIVDTHWTQPDPDTQDAAAGEIKLDYVKTAEATHSYPVTRVLWEPPSSQKQSTDLLATSGDHLRLWSLPNSQPMQGSNSITRPTNQRDAGPSKLSPLALLSNSKSPEHTAPITSLDWNTISPSLIITSSIDTTCTIWDIPTLTAKTQLIAHDKEVFDVRFCANSVDVFVSCGADGSVRMFDLRSLEHSTIIYEPSDKNDKQLMSPGKSSPSGPSQSGPWSPPLLRIAASPHDAHLLATFSQDSNVVRVLDVRQPGQALLELKGHSAALNCLEWSPNRRGVLSSGGDDCLVLLWDLINQHNAAPLSPPAHNPGAPSTTSERGPAAAWQCDYEISNISWSPQGGPNHSGHSREWLGVCGGRGIWGVAL